MSPATQERVKRFSDYAPALLFALVGFLYMHDDARRQQEHEQFAISFAAIAERLGVLETDVAILKHDAASPPHAGE